MYTLTVASSQNCSYLQLPHVFVYFSTPSHMPTYPSHHTSHKPHTLTHQICARKVDPDIITGYIVNIDVP